MTGIGRRALAAKGRDFGQDIGEEHLQRIGRIVDLLQLEAQMPARPRPLDDDGVRGMGVPVRPPPGDDPGRAPGGDDRDQLRPPATLQILGEIQRQPGAREDDIDPLVDRRGHQFREVRQRHHDIDPQDALGAEGLRPPDLLAQGPGVGGQKVLEQIRLDHPDAGAGDDPDPARGGHGRGQPGQGHADAHAALDDGQRCGQVPDAQRRRATLGHEWRPFCVAACRQVRSRQATRPALSAEPVAATSRLLAHGTAPRIPRAG